MIKVSSALLTIIIGLACLAGLSDGGVFADDIETPVTVTVLVLDHITLTPVNPTATLGTTATLQFTATANYSDGTPAGTDVSVTNSANWTSSNTGVATVGLHTGLATILTAGSTTITTTYGGKTDITTLTVLSGTVSPPGGGGGGGGGVVGEKRITSLISSITQTGRILEDIEAQSVDTNLKLLIKKNTIATNRVGLALTSITVEKLATPPDKPVNTEFIGSVYDIGPNGARFEPPARLTLRYDYKLLPEGVTENGLYISTWNEANSAWEKIGSTVDPENDSITANLNHLSVYAIMAGTRPADLVLSDLTVNPVEVDINKDVTVSVLATNTGDLTGSFDVNLKIDNAATKTQTVTLKGQDSQTISFIVNSGAAGEHTVSINNLSTIFGVKESIMTLPPTASATPKPSIAPEPSRFSLSGLSVTPAEARPTEKFTISVLVTNAGGSEGSYTVILKINEVEEATQRVAIEAGKSKTITFSTAKDTPGSYKVNVNENLGQFTVIPSPQLPQPAGALPVTPQTNWWLIGGIILGGLCVVGLLVYLFVLRTRGIT